MADFPTLPSALGSGLEPWIGVVFVMVTLRVRSMVWFATGIALTLVATLLVMQTWRVDAAPGDSDSTWVPIEPCRLFDYRPGELPDGSKKTLLAVGSPATQQVTGSVGNCVIPTTGVIGVSMNITVVDGNAQSNLRLYPADATEPLVSNLNWKAGDSATANKVDVKLSATGEIKLANFAGSVNVIGDVVGFYTDSSLKELAAGLTEANTKIAALEASEPFAVSNFDSSSDELTTTPKSYVDVAVAAPVAGEVTLNYSTQTLHGIGSAFVSCAPFKITEIPDSISSTNQGRGQWMAFQNNAFGSISGTASFEIAAGTSMTYSLACEQSEAGGSVASRTMTAIFTPTPTP